MPAVVAIHSKYNVALCVPGTAATPACLQGGARLGGLVDGMRGACLNLHTSGAAAASQCALQTVTAAPLWPEHQLQARSLLWEPVIGPVPHLAVAKAKSRPDPYSMHPGAMGGPRMPAVSVTSSRVVPTCLVYLCRGRLGWLCLTTGTSMEHTSC